MPRSAAANAGASFKAGSDALAMYDHDCHAVALHTFGYAAQGAGIEPSRAGAVTGVVDLEHSLHPG